MDIETAFQRGQNDAMAQHNAKAIKGAIPSAAQFFGTVIGSIYSATPRPLEYSAYIEGYLSALEQIAQTRTTKR